MSDGSAPQHERPLAPPENDPSAPLAVILGKAETAAAALHELTGALADGGMALSATLAVVSDVHESLLEIRAAAQRIQAPARSSASVAGRGRVLVVDDDDAIRKVMRRMLKEYDVEVAINGEEALRAIATRPPYDVILCDLVMPIMDGITLHEELSRRAPELAARVIFVTGGMGGRGPQSFDAAWARASWTSRSPRPRCSSWSRGCSLRLRKKRASERRSRADLETMNAGPAFFPGTAGRVVHERHLAWYTAAVGLPWMTIAPELRRT